MGFLRKALWVGTGGVSGMAGVKANSKKARTANALEQQSRLMQQQARQASGPHRDGRPGGFLGAFMTTVSGPPVLPLPGPPALSPRGSHMSDEVSGADEIARLRALADGGYLSPSEFKVQKAALLALGQDVDPSLFRSGELSKLADLVRSGTITREEFDSQKPDLLWKDNRAPLMEEAPSVANQSSGAVPLLSEELAALARLRDSGALTEEEFSAAKARLLKP
jgi:hypothetical protein